MSDTLMTSSLDHGGDEVCLALAGELDLSVAEQLQTALDEALALAPKTLIIDLGAVSYIDSHSVGLILRARNTATSDGHRLVVINAHGLVQQILDLMGVLTFLAEAPDDPTR